MKIALLSRLPIVLAGTAVAALSFACPARANLITNGDFETPGDFTGWTVMRAPPSQSHLFVHTPFEGPDTTQAACFGGSVLESISQSFATTANAFYTLTFFYQVGTSTGVHNEFNVLWNGTSIGSPFPNVDAIPGYSTFTFTLQATGSLTTLEFEGRNSGGANGFDYLDDVSVEPMGAVPDGGSTVVLLGFASLGLVALRRMICVD